MAKIAIISDTHFGVSNDSPLFLEESRKFFEKFLFPYLRKHKIKTIIHAGDTFDKRKLISYKTMDFVKKFYFQPMNDEFELHCLIGNHDCPYRNTNVPNSVELLTEASYPNIKVYNSPQEIVVEGEKICMIPWINKENKDETQKVIEASNASILFGHLELAGFTMLKGIECREGMSSKIFSKFEYVFSGHFHFRSTKGNIHYVGNPHETTWADFGNPKGFHVMDLKTRKLTFHENPEKIYVRFDYNSQREPELPKTLVGKYVHIEEVYSEKESKLEAFRKKVDALNPFDVKVRSRGKIVDIDKEEVKEDEEIHSIEETISLFIDETVALASESQTKKLKSFILDLYKQAGEIE